MLVQVWDSRVVRDNRSHHPPRVCAAGAGFRAAAGLAVEEWTARTLFFLKTKAGEGLRVSKG